MGIVVFTGFFFAFGVVDVSGLVRGGCLRYFIYWRLEVWGKEKRCLFLYFYIEEG